MLYTNLRNCWNYWTIATDMYLCCIFNLIGNVKWLPRGYRDRYRMAVWIYLHHQCLSTLMLWVRTRSWRGVLDGALCDEVCQWLATSRWFSTSTPFSSTNKTDRHDITDILLKVALNTMTLSSWYDFHIFEFDKALHWITQCTFFR